MVNSNSFVFISSPVAFRQAFVLALYGESATLKLFIRKPVIFKSRNNIPLPVINILCPSTKEGRAEGPHSVHT